MASIWEVGDGDMFVGERGGWMSGACLSASIKQPCSGA